METRQRQNQRMSSEPRSALTTRIPGLLAAGLLLFAPWALPGDGQQTNPLPNRPIVIPNRTLSPDEMKSLADKNARKRNFDAANIARKQAIDDETNKLLILARDLKAKSDSMGSDPPSPLMLREAAVIEFLANDVKEKMKLTVNPD